MWAVSLSLGEALDAFAGPTHVSTPQGPPQGGCIRGPHISIALQQKTANFKVTMDNRVMQWSVLTDKKQRINIHEQSLAA